jgi:NAD(P)-binding Rossmann-like domain
MSARPSEFLFRPETVPKTAEAELEKGQARDKKGSQFDYIIVGSGAGGGPLAARLALAGKKVLVIEAGTDPAKVDYENPNEGGDIARPASYGPDLKVGEVTRVPGYYGAASEDPEMSWMFSVRHYKVRSKHGRPNPGKVSRSRSIERPARRRWKARRFLSAQLGHRRMHSPSRDDYHRAE